MNGAELITKILLKNNVKNVFGLPGSTTLDLLYAFNSREPEITVHLNYSEFAAAYAAIGYAQISNNTGVVYTSRGPGLTNIITPIVDAFYDSIPLIVITAHTYDNTRTISRVDYDQEIYCEDFLLKHVKHISRIDSHKMLAYEINYAIHIANNGRKGPVVIDINKKLLSNDVDKVILACDFNNDFQANTVMKIDNHFRNIIENSKRPVILIGGGAKSFRNQIEQFSIRYNIPVLSSRSSQDVMKGIHNYYGYIGSHGTRYANFIISKADVIISLGNRLGFPINSKSYRPLIESKVIIRVDIDLNEFSREIPNTYDLNLSVSEFISLTSDFHFNSVSLDWLKLCKNLKIKLMNFDFDYPVNIMVDIFNLLPESASVVVDVGNNTFWASNSYEKSKFQGRILYSRSYAVMGSSLPKGIGAYYYEKAPIVVIVGDLAIQSVIGELNYLSVNQLPLKILIINNYSSGMVRDNELAGKYGKLLHTTEDSGYFVPNFEFIANSYGIKHYLVNENLNKSEVLSLLNEDGPAIIELIVRDNPKLIPTLEINSPIQDLTPKLDRDFYDLINAL